MFRDRVEAGRQLARLVVTAGLGGDRTVVLGLPRGGVPVAAQVSLALEVPLDVIVVRNVAMIAPPFSRALKTCVSMCTVVIIPCCTPNASSSPSESTMRALRPCCFSISSSDAR